MSVGESRGGQPRWNKRTNHARGDAGSHLSHAAKVGLSATMTNSLAGLFSVADSNSSTESSSGLLPVGRPDHRRFEFSE